MKKQVFVFLILLLISMVSAGQLQVTEERPFLVNNNWISAKQLVVGDLLTTIDGKKARITGIQDVEENILVYNLEDSFYHNYVADNLIVHNSNKYISCFTGDTKILMADGSEKRIDELTKGETILSWDFSLNKTAIAKINNVVSIVHNEIFSINNLINVTAEHPFYTLEKGWAAINPLLTKKNHNWQPEKLEVGQHLMNSEGKYILVDSIVKEENVSAITYNLDINKYNNYFAENILVHNKAVEYSRPTYIIWAYNQKVILVPVKVARDLKSLLNIEQIVTELAHQPRTNIPSLGAKLVVNADTGEIIIWRGEAGGVHHPGIAAYLYGEEIGNPNVLPSQIPDEAIGHIFSFELQIPRKGAINIGETILDLRKALLDANQQRPASMQREGWTEGYRTRQILPTSRSKFNQAVDMAQEVLNNVNALMESGCSSVDPNFNKYKIDRWTP